MGLINLLTDPKNFKFYNGGQGYTGNGNQPGLTNIPYGKDRIDGGSSGQPYIQIPIPDDISNLGAANKDFILRGGTLAVSNSATDALRLTKMFGDLKSPSGLLFIAKQQLLSRTAVRTQASGKELNEGIYNPLTTIAQAGAVAFGTHLNKQSLIVPYSEVVKNDQQPENNRLYSLYNEKIINNKSSLPGIKGFATDPISLNPLLISYSGGPGSTLGIGKTNIRFADQRTGENNSLVKTNPSYFAGNYYDTIGPSISILNDSPVFLHNRGDIVEKQYFSTVDSFKLKKGVSQTYFNLTPSSILNFSGPFLPVEINTGDIYPDDLINNQKSVYTQGNTFPENSSRINDNGTYVYTQNDIISQVPVRNYSTTQDFRAVLRGKIDQKGLTSNQAKNLGQLTNAPSYNIGDKQTIETRVNLGDPGNRAGRNYSSYTAGVTGVNEGALDKINAFPIYRSEKVTSDPIKNDLCKFRIAVIDNNEPTYKTFVHFRAFLDSISDSYNADWSPTKYLGRGENFYNYNGFTRQISLSWTVAAQSRQELIPMYKKLNYLASSLTPEYSPNGYMRGNMVQLTIGGYLYEQPGIITGLTYNIQEDTTWEIGINDIGGVVDENVEGTIFDSSVKELPHILRVTGFNFIPIHRFRPEIQNPGDENDYKHFIALANGEGAQKNNYGSDTPSVVDNLRTNDPKPTDTQRNNSVLLRPEQRPGFIGPVIPSRDQQILNNVLSGNPLRRFNPFNE
jgi:hypothetical protein